MKSNTEVERWFAERKHPQEQALRRVREIILGADPRMTEVVQYGTIQFVYERVLANFVQLSKKPITLMFNVGALIPAASLVSKGPSRTRASCDSPTSPRSRREPGSSERSWSPGATTSRANVPAEVRGGSAPGPLLEPPPPAER
jgi:uncharacterized protein DUF1801